MKKIKMTKKLYYILKAYITLYTRLESKFEEQINQLEKSMQKETGIEEIEFFYCGGEMTGIGNTSRTIKLILREELKK